MGGGILPVAKRNKQVYFLFGLEEEDKLWSDFGGGREKNETPFETALREGYEELDGFLGTKAALSKLVIQKGFLQIQTNNYTSFIFQLPYNDALPNLFNAHRKFIKTNMPALINKGGFFEKALIKWMTFADLKKKRHTFRPFYRQIIDEILHNEDSIRAKLLG
jgi:8-oxo-dGTP pyrophosphatase MutT (NUDIX family)